METTMTVEELLLNLSPTVNIVVKRFDNFKSQDHHDSLLPDLWCFIKLCENLTKCHELPSPLLRVDPP